MLKIEITLKFPHCTGTNIVKNGIKAYGVQNYLCKDCGRQFIGDHALTYQGCHSYLYHKNSDHACKKCRSTIYSRNRGY